MSQQTQKIVDLRLPLHWLVGAAVAIATFMITLGWQAAGQTNKLDQIIVAYAKLEKRLDDRDMRLDTLRDTVYELRRTIDLITQRTAMLEGRDK